MVYNIILTLLVLLPGVPLTVSWSQLLVRRYLDKENVALPYAVLIISTLSLLWFMAESRWHEIWGGYYSELRYAVIAANFMIDLAASGLGGLIEDPRRWWIISSAGAVSIDWYYAAVVNAAV